MWEWIKENKLKAFVCLVFSVTIIFAVFALHSCNGGDKKLATDMAVYADLLNKTSDLPCDAKIRVRDQLAGRTKRVVSLVTLKDMLRTALDLCPDDTMLVYTDPHTRKSEFYGRYTDEKGIDRTIVIGRRPNSAVPMPIREPKVGQLLPSPADWSTIRPRVVRAITLLEQMIGVMDSLQTPIPSSAVEPMGATPTTGEVVTPDEAASITDAGGTTYIPLASPPPPDSTVWEAKAVPFTAR